MSKTTADTAQAATANEAPPKAKGARPTHRLSRVTEVEGKKSYEEVGALWPHRDGKGFSLKIKATLQTGDNLIVRMAGGPS